MECGKRTQHERGEEEFKFIPRRGPASPDYIRKREGSRKEVSRREMGLSDRFDQEENFIKWHFI